MDDEMRSEEDIKKEMAAWKPGLKAPKKSKLERALADVGDMTPDERKALKARLAELLK